MMAGQYLMGGVCFPASQLRPFLYWQKGSRVALREVAVKSPS